VRGFQNFDIIKKTASELRLLTETNTQDVTFLASEFGMGSGVAKLLWPSSKLWIKLEYLNLFIAQ